MAYNAGLEFNSGYSGLQTNRARLCVFLLFPIFYNNNLQT